MAPQGLGYSARHLRHKNLSIDPSQPEIRLLEVRPAQNIDDTVYARLVNIPLTLDLDFIGLSALYGDTDETEAVNIDGKKIAVPANLGQALRHVRAVFWPSQDAPGTLETENLLVDEKGTKEPDAARRRPHWLRHLLRSFRPSNDGDRSRNQSTTLRVWIDAFCIDNNSPREMKDQHILMATAYRHAKTVVGWLGEKDETSDLAVHLIRVVDKALPANFGSPEDKAMHPEHYAPRHIWMGEIQHLWQLPEGVTDLREFDNFIAISKFLKRQYFQRDWILNEIAMATFPTFLVGADIVSWSEVLRWNRCNEELSDVGTAKFPEEYRDVLDSFLPLGTVYTMLKEFERNRDYQIMDPNALRSPRRSSSTRST